MNWQNLEVLDQRFRENCDALATRDPAMASRLRAHQPADVYAVAAQGDQLKIARVVDQTANVIAYRLTPDGAQQVAQRLCPNGKYSDPILVAGIDQGWLWQLLHQAPIDSPGKPGHTPPLFFWAREWDALWVATHLHDWRALLADPRVQIYVGADAYEQGQRAVQANVQTGTPRLSVTLDPALWPAGKTLDTFNGEIGEALGRRLQTASERVRALYADVTEHSIAARLREGARLRVMGITSRYTTFLQHSMRDWLAAFEAMGHETRLMIEGADHEQLNTLVLAEAAAEFRPELILMIDHFRAELGGLPDNCPAVMWIQDHMPNIQTASAGAAQGPMDYVIGYHRTECTTRFGYPLSRFMAASIGVNDERFAPVALSTQERARLECDVSYVSHASKPAELIVQETIAQNGNDQTSSLLQISFERLKAVYDQGGFLTHPLHLRGIIERACVETRTAIEPDVMRRLTDLFVYRINNALFRHQVLEWVAETGVSLRIYGNGWEQHPRLGRFAQGPADNARDLVKIYGASRINLQAMPHGIMHQRLLEGLASGGFFLVRYVPGDVIDRVYKPLWEWCLREGVETDEQLIQRATPDVLKLLGELQRTLGLDPFKLGMQLVDDMRHGADVDFVRSPAFWPEYEQVAFDTRASLHARIKHFLAHPEERASLTNSMRKRVLDRLSYKAVNRRMLGFIAGELTSRSVARGAAA